MAKDEHRKPTKHEGEVVSEHDHADKPQEVEEGLDRGEETKLPDDKAGTAHDEPAKDPGKKPNPIRRCWHWALTHKKISIPVALLLLLAILTAVPFTRYLVAGTVLKQSFPVVVVDADTGKPVSSATVRLAGKEAVTDNEGRAEVRTNVGYAKLEVSKKYYESASANVLVPLKKPSSPHEVKLKATGRAVPVTVLNKISKKSAANVTIKAADEDTEAKTDAEGKATLVVPADKQEVKISLSGEGFNGVEAILKVTADDDPANTFEVTPSGKMYFLSNASGKIDLVKSNLDGSDRQTVLAGTGKEDSRNTVLLASRDWKYIALLSKRDGGEHPKLFLVETTNNKLTTMDEGDATFTPHGWSDDRFIYTVNRVKLKDWEPRKQSLKSYSASTKKIATLTDTAKEGDQDNYASERIDGVYVLGEETVFMKRWYGSRKCYYCTWIGKDNQTSFNSVRADGGQKKVIKSYSDYPSVRTAEFDEIYILYQENSKGKVDEYHDGKITTIDQTQEEFHNKEYPRYAVSPSGGNTLWSENRDGKNVFFVGDSNGENGKEIGRSDEFTIYGWFTDEYVLLTKKGSEMYIMPADGLDGGVEKALKISDYYKPDGYYNRGFGYGYGG